MIDDDSDGNITEGDLLKVLQQLGSLALLPSASSPGAQADPSTRTGYNTSPAMLSSYFAASGSQRSINFTTFLTMVC